jgi:outer membrane biosynthesis protein TonB
VPTKTGDKVRIIVLGTGPDAETARLIAESDADVALAKQFTKTVTHLVADDTVKPTEARLKKAEEAGVPVLTVDEFKALLVAGAEDEVDEVVEAELQEAPAETPVAVVDTEPEPEPEAEPEPEPEPEPEAAEEPVVEPEPAPEPVEEPEPIADPEPEAAEEPVAETESESKKDEIAEPVAEAIDEPEEVPADPEKTVPSQAEAPTIETDAKSDGKGKPSFLDKIKSIFGLSTAKK